MCPQKLWQQVHGCFRLQQAASNRHAYSYTSCARRSVHFVRAGSTINVKASVRWATGKRLTNRLPKLSLITLSPPFNSGILGLRYIVPFWGSYSEPKGNSSLEILGLRMGPYVPTPKFFTISGDPGRVICHVIEMRKFTFL